VFTKFGFEPEVEVELEVLQELPSRRWAGTSSGAAHTNNTLGIRPIASVLQKHAIRKLRGTRARRLKRTQILGCASSKGEYGKKKI
jgi:hypothetical protein